MIPLALLIAAQISGCSASSKHVNANDHTSDGSAAAYPTYPFPLESYLETPQQQAAEFDAESILTNRCAKGFGLKLALPTKVAPKSEFLANYYGNIRPVTVLGAKEDGYQLGASGPGAQMNDSSPASRSPLAGLAPAELEIINGWSPQISYGLPKPSNPFILNGGCVLQTARLIEGSSASHDASHDPENVDNNYVNGLVQQSIDQATSKPEFISKVSAWSSCMSRNSYKGYSTFTSAILRFNLNLPTTKAQIAMAVQDAKCKAAVGVMPLWARLIKKAQTQLVNADSQELVLVKQHLQARLTRVAALVAK